MHYVTLMLLWLAEALPSPRSLEPPLEDCLFGEEEARALNGSDHFLLKWFAAEGSAPPSGTNGSRPHVLTIVWPMVSWRSPYLSIAATKLIMEPIMNCEA